MFYWAFLAWAAVGMGLGALRAGLTQELTPVRELKIGFGVGLAGGLCGWLLDDPAPGAFSVVSVLMAGGSVACALLLDWLLDEERAHARSARP